MIAVRLLILFAALLHPFSFAALFNVTIDDQNGDPTNGLKINYNPPSAWHAGQTCTTCTAKVIPATDAWMWTWTDGSFNPVGTNTNNVPGQIIQASLSFTGVAVYVNVILTGTESFPISNTDYTFILDNKTEGVFQKAPDGDPVYHFNQTVFSKDGLANTVHTLRIEAGHSGETALVLLDSVIYTVDDGSSDDNISTTPDVSSTAKTISIVSASSLNTPVGSTSSSSTPVGAIVGPVIAVVLILGVILAFLYRRRQRKNDINNHYNHAEYRSSNRPIHSTHTSEAEVFPYSISSRTTDLPDQPGTNLSINQPKALNPPYIQNNPGITAQMRAVTRNDESASGSEIISPPAYNDVGHGPSPSTSSVSLRPLPLPPVKN